MGLGSQNMAQVLNALAGGDGLFIQNVDQIAVQSPVQLPLPVPAGVLGRQDQRPVPDIGVGVGQQGEEAVKIGVDPG